MIVIVVIVAYLGLVLIVGTVSHKFFRGTGEDYFVASRTIGPFVLLMSLFGTNMTAFSILGASRRSLPQRYRCFRADGIFDGFGRSVRLLFCWHPTMGDWETARLFYAGAVLQRTLEQ